MSARVVKVEGYVSVERKIGPNDSWSELHRYGEHVSIEQARRLMEMIEPVTPDTEHRLVYTRVETTKEVLPS
jgi:hypothetical protein